MAIQREPTRPGQESVWDYPRPPRVEPVSEPIRVVFNGATIAETFNAYRVLETSHPPVYYFPPEDIVDGVLRPIGRTSYCEWKGVASYFDVVHGARTAPAAAWAYEDPVEMFQVIAGQVAFYPALMDACYVGDEQARPQPGGFYGGWITSRIAGPFKGEPGSGGW